MNEPKPWWKSKTMRLNVAVGVLAVIEANMHLLQPYLPVNFYVAIAFGLPILNVGLRVVTSQPITFGGASAQPLE